ncbi:hypothetical protein SAY86_026730 [Trapa natans]|uniref:Protein kinase domain-containing protein n=1 Tax=Trapa natans TaxID=22666 RepID=A0AAN7KM19_TRANT|nr:hypothetical protein SAY86_026730 [Trapa natans]
MENGNLSPFELLIIGIGEPKMDWPSRLKVALAAARGLEYLYSSSAVGIPIIHRDFKSTNILLPARKAYATERYLCILGGAVGAADRTKSRGFEPRPERSEPRTTGNSHPITSKFLARFLSKSSYSMESIMMFANLASRCIRQDSSERPSMSDCVKELGLIYCMNLKGLGMFHQTHRPAFRIVQET